MDRYEADDETEGLAGDVPDAATLAAIAWTHVAAAVRSGRLRDAQGWIKLWRELKKAAAAEEEVKARSAESRVPEADSVDSVDSANWADSASDRAPDPAQAAKPEPPLVEAAPHRAAELHAAHPVSAPAPAPASASQPAPAPPRVLLGPFGGRMAPTDRPRMPLAARSP